MGFNRSCQPHERQQLLELAPFVWLDKLLFNRNRVVTRGCSIFTMNLNRRIITSNGTRYLAAVRTMTVACSLFVLGQDGVAQTPPTQAEIADYDGMHRAVVDDDVNAINDLIAEDIDLELTDTAGRTAVHIAAYMSNDRALRLLARAGADLDALDNQAYDVITIAAVANDLEFMDLALSLGASPGNVTSPYDGTALIAAAHLGHYDVVSRLIRAGAPLDHVNNLNWTALIEAVILGDGGSDHINTVRALVEGGADPDITDAWGVTALEHARQRQYAEIAELLTRNVQ